MVKRHW